MIRIGIVGFDTSHAVEFTKRLNHVDVEEKYWLMGAKVVAGYPGKPSPAASEDLLNERIEALKHYGVEIVDAPESLIGMVDAVMIEYNEGAKHLEASKPFIEAGLPVFIDKPLACSLEDAKKIFQLAESKGVPVFSASSLRYAVEVQRVKSSADELGRVLGVDAYGPGVVVQFNPGLFYYVIHAVEMLYALMGRGCRLVRCFTEKYWDFIMGRWFDGRVGVVRGLRHGGWEYGFTAFCENKVVSTTINTAYLYTELLKRVVEMFKTRKPPIDPREMLEVIAFTEKAMESARSGIDVEIPQED